MRLEFTVAGSGPEPYTVVFERRDGAAFATCTCAAGQAKLACKHRIALMDGVVSAVTGDNASDAAGLPALLDGTALRQAYQRVLEAAAAQEAAAKALTAAKRAMGRIMHPPG